MITGWFLEVWTGFLTFILGLVPSFTGSTANAGVMGILGPVSNGAADLGAWIPWTVVSIEAPIVIGMYVTSLILRVIKSLIPTISG